MKIRDNRIVSIIIISFEIISEELNNTKKSLLTKIYNIISFKKIFI